MRNIHSRINQHEYPGCVIAALINVPFLLLILVLVRVKHSWTAPIEGHWRLVDGPFEHAFRVSGQVRGEVRHILWDRWRALLDNRDKAAVRWVGAEVVGFERL